MDHAQFQFADDHIPVPPLADWVKAARIQTIDEGAFHTGAALNHLDLIVKRQDIPFSLIRNRLALRAAESCVGLAGRMERVSDLRDELAFLHPGDQLGPAGAIYAQWLRVVERPVGVRALLRAAPEFTNVQIETWLDVDAGSPVTQCAAVFKAVLTDLPRNEGFALVCTDVALARALGWSFPLPLLSIGIKSQDIRKSDEDLQIACHRAIVRAAGEVVHLASELTRKSYRLRKAAPKLRAKGAGAAVERFLVSDAIAPANLTDLMSDRAARRLCDRLVSLGVVQELTGRETFRLYGL